MKRETLKKGMTALDERADARIVEFVEGQGYSLYKCNCYEIDDAELKNPEVVYFQKSEISHIFFNCKDFEIKGEKK